MNRKVISVLFVLLPLFNCDLSAQTTFTITKASGQYDAKVMAGKCEEANCSGKGIIRIYKKNSTKLLQELVSQDLIVSLDSFRQPVQKMELYDEQSPLIFADFNFDGSEDLAIRNGNNSGYGGPSYDVYVFNKTKSRFVLSKALTDIASTNLGMFTVDPIKKRLKTFTKSGCCWHQSSEYKVSPSKGLVKVFETTEDATRDEQYVYLTAKKLVHGKWIKVSRRVRKSDYYRE